MSLRTPSATNVLVSSKRELNAILRMRIAHCPGCLRREEIYIWPRRPDCDGVQNTEVWLNIPQLFHRKRTLFPLNRHSYWHISRSPNTRSLAFKTTMLLILYFLRPASRRLRSGDASRLAWRTLRGKWKVGRVGSSCSSWPSEG